MRTLIPSVLLWVTLTALAAPMTFEEVDTDGDGLISAAEAASVEGLDFETADADADGTLNTDEYNIALETLSPPDAEAGEEAAVAAEAARHEKTPVASAATSKAVPVPEPAPAPSTPAKPHPAPPK